MLFRSQRSFARPLFFYAFPLAICLIFLFPEPSEAHPILLVSDPPKDAVLSSAPAQVRMQFSEILVSTFSTAVVVNAANHRVDRNDAHISSSNSREMDISLKPNLPSDVYVVVWQAQSAGDGHVLRSSFLFKVAAADGSIPSLKGPYPGQDALGGDNTTSELYTGQLNGPTLFSFVMVTLVDLSVVFWVGAQIWHSFVLQPSDTDLAEQRALDQRAKQGFELFFSIPILLEAFIANLGVLIGQGLFLTGGNLVQVFPLFGKLMSDGRFGTFWTLREIVLLLAFVLSIYAFRSRQRSPIVDEIISWTKLALGLTLLTAVTISGHAAATNDTILVYSVTANWLHLVAASLWIGGMMYLSVIYLPVLKGKSLTQCTRALLTTVASFSPLAIAGVVIMALTGPFNATVHMSSLSQLVTTAYGRALMVKVGCVIALLVTSAIHVRFFRPRLEKTFGTYEAKIAEMKENGDTDQAERPTAQEIKHLEENVARQTRRLIKVLRWEPVLGVAVLICTGLMSTFAGTLQPVTAQPNQQQPTSTPSPQGTPLTIIGTTADLQFNLVLTVTPNHSGPTVFTVRVLDSDGKQATNVVGVSLTLSTFFDDMTNRGPESINLQPDGKGEFRSQGDIPTSGIWSGGLQVRTPDNTLHGATVTFTTPD